MKPVVVMTLSLVLLSCGPYQGGSTTNPRAASLPAEDAMTLPPLGNVAGRFGSVAAMDVANPYEGNPQAVQQGKQLYIKMNCAGCHAYDGSGNMGPDLTDTYWRYGGLPIEIFKTIQEGRPQGMPAWGKALPPDEIWKVVAFLQSLGGTVDAQGYNRAWQGDRPGENVAPEAQADAQANVQPGVRKP